MLLNLDGLSDDSSDEWTSLLGISTMESRASGITSDLSGNIYATGYTSIALDGQILVGFPDLFVVKYNSIGEKQWTRLLGATDVSTFALGITSDLSGNIYTTGTTKGDMDGQSGTGFFCLFVVKYDSNGEKQWTRLLGTYGANAYATGITIDPSGNVYTTGYTEWSLDGQPHSEGMNQFIVKYNSNGEKQWTRLLSGYGRAIISDNAGNIYATSKECIAKYNSEGEMLWKIRIAGAAPMTEGITSDRFGNVYVTGTTGETIDGQPKVGQANLFVIKYNSNGEKQWTRLLGAAVSDTNAMAITSDSTGNVYTTGYTNGNLDGQSLTYNINMFVVKYDSDGNRLWTKLRAAYGKRTYSYGITLDASENIYTTGNVMGSLITGSDIGFYDLFVSRFNNE
ncbi:SBBP repeat-containing protein [Leptospira venezuelensis]|nr:SBBP repeat-containing protein [Leptospira venezuelensis]